MSAQGIVVRRDGQVLMSGNSRVTAQQKDGKTESTTYGEPTLITEHGTKILTPTEVYDCKKDQQRRHSRTSKQANPPSAASSPPPSTSGGTQYGFRVSGPETVVKMKGAIFSSRMKDHLPCLLVSLPDLQEGSIQEIQNERQLVIPGYGTIVVNADFHPGKITQLKEDEIKRLGLFQWTCKINGILSTGPCLGGGSYDGIFYIQYEQRTFQVQCCCMYVSGRKFMVDGKFFDLGSM